MLFVQDAEVYELVDGAIVLKNSRPEVFYFTDCPKRLAGYISRDQAVKIALKSFELVPPNAALVMFTDDQPVDVVLALNQAPAEEGKDLI